MKPRGLERRTMRHLKVGMDAVRFYKPKRKSWGNWSLVEPLALLVLVLVLILNAVTAGQLTAMVAAVGR